MNNRLVVEARKVVGRRRANIECFVDSEKVRMMMMMTEEKKEVGRSIIL